ncbi:hypothetical protein NLJ89_g9750 [Agrocybe chaxingu]|uniref:Plastocyanin-like domain-containing protein n=1 Tax=Agrocybe chaxingu TaxID=84603 RepID=A0A9W8JRU3_9AGAR|nr:hypothetical protein NLJ89_g9750 [Agrocybe chaxingu]
MHSSFLNFVILSVVAGAYAAIGPTAELYIGNADVAPDGFTRAGVLAGSDASSLAFPGPVITGNKGDTFSINVVDALSDTTMLTSTSIVAWADGPVGVTQCPISPGNSFLYEFSSGDQAGTFWYHSHDSTQYCDGLRGVMVVYDPEDPYLSSYDVDDESTIITLSDW